MALEVKRVSSGTGCAACAERRLREARMHELQLAYAQRPAAPAVAEEETDWSAIVIVLGLFVALLLLIRRNNQLADQVEELSGEAEAVEVGEG